MATATPTVELFVRSLTPQCQKQESLIKRLDRLQNAGQIAEYSVTVWGDSIAPGSPFAETEAGQRILERISRFEGWANTECVSLEGCFEHRKVDSSLLDTRYSELDLPTRMMAEYRHGELQFVTPHVDGGRTRTVQARLDELADQTAAFDTSQQVAPSVD